jgi:glycosyltransferase involved in cell wall biosynthesis
MEVAARWSHFRDVGTTMPEWAQSFHADRLGRIRRLGVPWLLERSPPGSFAALCFRYLTRSLAHLGTRTEAVVAASHYPFDLLPAVIIATRCRVPFAAYVFHLVSMHRTRGVRARLVGLWERLAIWLLRRAKVVLADNEEVRNELVARGLPRNLVHPTWNAPRPGPADSEGVSRQSNEVVFCGRITDPKGWPDLITLGEHLRETCSGVELRILGDGDRRRQLERAIHERGLERVVRVEGFVDETTKWRALRRAAVFVTPSREEGWGIAVSEALEAGAEVVCYDLPVYREVYGDSLHYVPLGDVQALVNRVVEVLRSSRRTPEQTAPAVRWPRTGALRTWNEIAAHEYQLLMADEGV